MSFGGELNEEFDIFHGFVGFSCIWICEFNEEAVGGWVKEHIAHETFWVTSWSHFCCWC